MMLKPNLYISYSIASHSLLIAAVTSRYGKPSSFPLPWDVKN